MGLMTTTVKVGGREITANCSGPEGSPVMRLVKLGNSVVEAEVDDNPIRGVVRLTLQGDQLYETGRSLILLGSIYRTGQTLNFRIEDETLRVRLGLSAGRRPDVVLTGNYPGAEVENAS